MPWTLNQFISSLSFLLILLPASSQSIVFEFERSPKNSGFKMDDYWVWCGSMIKAGNEYHLFASRWKKTGPFPEGYRQNSEIVRATSLSPLGPFEFREVVIGERDSAFWDSNMAHNPTIHKIGDEYVLFYIGSDFTTRLNERGNLLRRVGYATSKSIEGPWKRSPEPLIATESNNPAILADGEKITMVYRDEALRVYLATADNFRGPYKIINDNLWPESRIEDFYLFKSGKLYHMICEDNVGSISGHVRWGVHLFSADGISNWKKYDPVIIYDHDIVFEDNSVLRCTRRERPQLMTENGKITHIITAIYDGLNSWSMPVKLKKPVKVD